MVATVETQNEVVRRSERVKSVDFHPSEPWVLLSLYSGSVCIWNYKSQAEEKSFKVADAPVRTSRFVPGKAWIVVGSDDKFLRVYDYGTGEKIKEFQAHEDYIRCLAIHPKLPYVVSVSDDKLMKVWDWEKDWDCVRVFEGHSHYVMGASFNPLQESSFASASLDGTIRIWDLDSSSPKFTLEAHQKGLNCVHYLARGNGTLCLISGSDDFTVKVWDYETKSCVQTLEGHSHNVTTICVHPEMPIVVTGSEDGTARVWDATNFTLLNTFDFSLGRIWGIGCIAGSKSVALACDEGATVAGMCHQL
ncbi:hypothetical protein MLD38_005251 [Melastoma candidum]|uniref:Uncharacterized protein n=1 Tax=Melastoma candidum TaxID=119954 RepID=A0ACB9S8M8_9MYRT|nr:hypothetical protein MLD38_005251 [Melastoma candidum]